MIVTLFVSFGLYVIIIGIVINDLYKHIKKQNNIICSLKDQLNENINNFNWLLSALKMKIHNQYSEDCPYEFKRSIIEQEDNKVKLLYDHLKLEIIKIDSIPEKYSLVKKS